MKEDVFLLGDGFDQWLDENMEFADSLEDPDDGVWHYLSTVNGNWQNRPSTDNFSRYNVVRQIVSGGNGGLISVK